MIKNLAPAKAKPLSNLTKEAAELWQSLSIEYDIADSGGLLLLSTALEAFDRMRQAQAMLKESGLVVSTASGMKPSPGIALERDSRQGMLVALRHLHLDVEPMRDKIGRPPKG